MLTWLILSIFQRNVMFENKTEIQFSPRFLRCNALNFIFKYIIFPKKHFTEKDIFIVK